jgi:hypothetical protein
VDYRRTLAAAGRRRETLATPSPFANAAAGDFEICALANGARFGKIGRVLKLEQEQRVAFRVAVRRDSGIDAALFLGGKKLAAAVRDISAEGMLLRLERGALAALKVGGNVDVEVLFDGEKLHLRGVIRSEHDGGYGVYFPPRDRLGRPNPIARYERISAHLQRSSLSQRLKVLKLPSDAPFEA